MLRGYAEAKQSEGTQKIINSNKNPKDLQANNKKKTIDIAKHWQTCQVKQYDN